MQKTTQEQYWAIKLAQAAKALEQNNFAVSIHADAAKASEYILETLIPEHDIQTIGIGGSVTVQSSGLLESLRLREGVELYDVYAPGISREEILALRHMATQADMYLASSNAVTMRGELVNLDGSSNRISAMHFGPRLVVLLVGRNKLCTNLEAARVRIKELAAPMNSMRLGRNNPCSRTGTCHNCQSPERICSVWTITEKCFPPQRIHVMLLNQDLGF